LLDTVCEWLYSAISPVSSKTTGFTVNFSVKPASLDRFEFAKGAAWSGAARGETRLG